MSLFLGFSTDQYEGQNEVLMFNHNSGDVLICDIDEGQTSANQLECLTRFVIGGFTWYQVIVLLLLLFFCVCIFFFEFIM